MTPFIHKNRDSHDLQWETYRSNIPILVVCMVSWYFISRAIEISQNDKSWLLGGLILVYSFRSDLLIYMALLILWYVFTIKCNQSTFFISICWTIVISTLYFNELSNHFSYLSEIVGNIMPIQWFNSS